jgi:hypothetical protein
MRLPSTIGLHSRRHIFGLLPSTRRQDRVMSYAEQRVIGFSDAEMFDVVNTVAEYPKFVPWCKEVSPLFGLARHI